MKVRCIDNLDGGLNLSIGKEYEVYKSTLDEHTTYYQLKNDFGTTQYYPQRHFEVVNEKDNKQQIKLQCSSCLHDVICGHRDEWKRYCKEHIELRKKSVLFDEDPSCRYYIDKSVLEKKEEKPKEIKVDKVKIDKKILDNFKKQPLIYTRPENDIFNDDLRWNFSNKKVKTENGWEYKDEELNHIVEDTTSKKRKLNEDEFVALLSKILSV